ncbi:hypothetical protein MIMGU_mgv1a021751mg [Erythranthe guttata]|uniref:Uncharacterized protein n=1 Tax=Erythranthe guttata TaxID=4155 RepID=A0A022PXL3_ERYGU|nr:hypothetical protein MIMGU_mgv1a021751mg [Erythranthe guttata]
MPREAPFNTPDIRAYLTHPSSERKPYKGKRHSVDRCWSLHPEMKPKFVKDRTGGEKKKVINTHKAHLAAHTVESFSSNPATLLNEFANFLQERHGQEALQNKADTQGYEERATLLGKLAGFLSSNASTENRQANVKCALVKAKEKINIVSDTIESDVLYVPSFPFQLLSVRKLILSLNCEVIFTPYKVIFQDLVTRGVNEPSSPLLAGSSSSSSSSSFFGSSSSSC